jgi:rhodanese-related sulfurtransferase
MPTLAMEIGWDELQEARQSDARPRVIDCREADEWDICHMEGAQLVPLSRFAEEAPLKLGSDKEQWLVVYCHHGVRSLRATQWLRQQGYTQTQSLRGGIDLWAECVEPDMRRY